MAKQCTLRHKLHVVFLGGMGSGTPRDSIMTFSIQPQTEVMEGGHKPEGAFVGVSSFRERKTPTEILEISEAVLNRGTYRSLLSGGKHEHVHHGPR